jgi:hypothetical protein
MVLIAQQRKKFMRCLLILQQRVCVLQTEIALRVRGVDRVAKDGDGFNGCPANIWINVRIVLDNPKETL